MALIASPFALMGACGGDDTATPRAGTSGSAGTAGTAVALVRTAGSGGSAAGSGGSAAGSGGSAAGAGGSAAGAGGSAAGAGGSAAGAGGGAGSASTDGGAKDAALPACTSTKDTDPAFSAADDCATLATVCKGGDLKAAYAAATCAATYEASTKKGCQTYHLCMP